MNTRDKKISIRRQMQAERQALTAADVARLSSAIETLAGSIPELAAARAIASYLALPWEVSSDGLIAMALRNGATVAVPARDGDRYGLAAFDAATALSEGPFGVREPAEPVWVDPSNLDAILVPGVAFDRDCNRLGHGGGYYDRMLSELIGPATLRIGLAFDFQVIPSVPTDENDMRMDFVVTETEIIGNSKGAMLRKETSWHTSL